MGRPQALSMSRHEEAAYLYVSEEWPLSTLAEHFGVTVETVRGALKRMNVKLRRRGGNAKLIDSQVEDEILHRYLDGATQQEIGDSLGVSQRVISRRLIAMGLCTQRRSVRASNWKGGKIKTDGGYVAVRIDPDNPFFCMANKNNYVPEHRLVMAQHLGRALTKDETVHHIDGNREHNDVTNLQLRFGNHGKGSAWSCAKCGCTDLVPVTLEE